MDPNFIADLRAAARETFQYLEERIANDAPPITARPAEFATLSIGVRATIDTLISMTQEGVTAPYRMLLTQMKNRFEVALSDDTALLAVIAELDSQLARRKLIDAVFKEPHPQNGTMH